MDADGIRAHASHQRVNIARPPGGRSAMDRTTGSSQMITPALGALIAAGALCGCSGLLVDPSGCALPVVSRATAIADSTNVLRAFVSAAVRGADSVVVRFGVGVALDAATPRSCPTPTRCVAPILGLEPARTYSAQLVAYSACGATTSDALTFTTGALPADLPTLHGRRPGTGSGLRRLRRGTLRDRGGQRRPRRLVPSVPQRSRTELPGAAGRTLRGPPADAGERPRRVRRDRSRRPRRAHPRLRARAAAAHARHDRAARRLLLAALRRGAHARSLRAGRLAPARACSAPACSTGAQRATCCSTGARSITSRSS